MSTAAEQIHLLDLDDLAVSKLNPRTNVGDVSELAASIKDLGVLEPLIAIRQNGSVQVVAGRRRLAAAKKAGLHEVPVRVMEFTDAQAAAAALIENLQRKDLDPLEEAEGYRSWLQLTGKKQSELAAAVHRDPSTISNALRLLEAPKPVKDALAAGTITPAHARVAMSVPEKALPLLELKKDVSVKELEEQAKHAQRSYTAVERLRVAIEKAEKSGKVVTWGERSIWLGGTEVDLRRAFGEPKKKLAGVCARGYYGVEKATHDVVCDCEALAIDSQGALVAACVSPTGWKKAEQRSQKNMRRSSPTAKKKAKIADQKRREIERDTKAAIREADDALNFKKLRSYHPLKTNVPAALLKGGIAGEPARIVLFGEVVQNASGSNESKTWEVELWKKIATLPLKAVREYVTKWAVAAALEEIRGTRRFKAYGSSAIGLGQNNASVITQLVNTHYGVRGQAKKKVKR